MPRPQTHQEYARQCGLDNLATAEKIYSLFDGNEHFAALIDYTRTAYRDAIEFLYINARGEEYDEIDEKVFKSHLDGFIKVLQTLREMGGVLQPVKALELFPEPEPQPTTLSQIFAAAGYPGEYPVSDAQGRPIVLMAGTGEKPL